ncbi:DUF4340 domain-containing protein [Candidatus Roizmanbacteria bacterium]|nr:DUF4340 domain-containing protein [Candidatus Roizmanbacteria bacterium]
MRKKIRKRLVMLIGILVFLCFFYLFKEKIKDLILPNNGDIIISDDKKNITQIELVGGRDKIPYFLKNGTWYCKKNNQTFKANEENVKKIISAFLSLKKDEIVSNNAKKHANFEVNSQKVSIVNDGKTFSVYVGKNVGYDKNYLRLNEENDVFIGGGFYGVFSDADCRDLKVNLIKNENDITEISLDHNSKKLSLKKQGERWVLNNKEIKKERIDFFINELATLKGNDVFTSNPELGNLEKSLVINLKIKNQNKTLGFYRKDNYNYYLKISESDLVYQISSTYVESLKKEEGNFVD